MVSGLVISPWDHSMIFSGLASVSFTTSKSCGSSDFFVLMVDMVVKLKVKRQKAKAG